METIVIVILCIALAVFGVMTLGQGFMTATDIAALSVEDITVSKGESARTGISIIDGRSTGITTVELVMENAGQVKMASFDKWDMIVEYYDNDYVAYSKWLPYTDGTLNDNEWLISGLFLDASANTPEAFEPNVLNPEEEMRLIIELNPPPRAGSTVITTVITPNGIADSYSFLY
ncbi:MAG: flagellin [Dehalococcoidales bacterium]|nr:flagellin [Dehalococcoidales bacterium]